MKKWWFACISPPRDFISTNGAERKGKKKRGGNGGHEKGDGKKREIMEGERGTADGKGKER